MTVEIEYSLPSPRTASDWQKLMAKQIEENEDFPIANIERELSGTTFIVRVETNLPSQAVESMLSDIEEYLDAGSEHLETCEV